MLNGIEKLCVTTKKYYALQNRINHGFNIWLSFLLIYLLKLIKIVQTPQRHQSSFIF